MALAETHRLKGLHIRLLKPPYKGFLYFSSYFFLHVQVTLRLRYLKFTHASLQVPSQKKKKKSRPKSVWLLRLGEKNGKLMNSGKESREESVLMRL